MGRILIGDWRFAPCIFETGPHSRIRRPSKSLTLIDWVAGWWLVLVRLSKTVFRHRRDGFYLVEKMGVARMCRRGQFAKSFGMRSFLTAWNSNTES